MSIKNGLTVDTFTQQGHVRTAWIAYFTLFVFWGLFYCLRHLSKAERNHGPGPEHDIEGRHTTEERHGSSEKVPAWKLKNGFHSPLKRAHRLAFENMMLLLTVLVLDTFGSGSGRAVMIIAWIYVGFTILISLTELMIDNRYYRFMYSLMFYGLTLAIGGLAFKQGW
ncbi:hypothetical protein J3Q64DRAFT_1766778 [Phycomyces blakesleeanus]|uniref:Uncharacterized protein n=2 Tax=Phycomyces blakesleeanus TaxID=4837 RepID=A0A167N6T9_PHYB8|nr:hypothetical protein PHYBLDRAFT_167487 [Phycomyces blakesleeanus NRRL 1555(-)]OAD75169.1 hypothetical protein PHYBLDRAFT_167487 [Phycomyces blakesleeanus NRRL 1555(-)]|eukprot:XP_018293209.1 hypothetical protein PHYBLDRAFT_167487 [Phycomyces blakesleeanus NRRL 1555(-)]